LEISPEKPNIIISSAKGEILEGGIERIEYWAKL